MIKKISDNMVREYYDFLNSCANIFAMKIKYFLSAYGVDSDCIECFAVYNLQNEIIAGSLFIGHECFIASKKTAEIDELVMFLAMQEKISTAMMSLSDAKHMTKTLGKMAYSGSLMKCAPKLYNHTYSENKRSVDTRQMYELIIEAFAHRNVPFDEWYVGLSHLMRRGVCDLFGEYNEDKLIGVCAVEWVDEDSAMITNVAVSGEYRRHGIGSKLVKISLDELAKREATAYLISRTEITDKIYANLGFEVCGSYARVNIERNRGNI